VAASLVACGGDGATTPTDATQGADGADAATDWACDPVAQTGCGESENCTFTTASGDRPVCTAQGDLGYSEPCLGGSCERGICLSLNATEFLCYRFCSTPEDCSEVPSCLTLTGAPYGVCEIPGIYTPCDLLAQSCEQDKACHWVSGQESPICLPAGQGAIGSECAGNAARCRAGLACVNDRCEALCALDAAAPCGPGSACVTLYEPQGAGYCER